MHSRWWHVDCCEAGGVTYALTRALELHPDTVLVDIGLPDGDGLDLARELRAMPWPLRIVIVSTDAEAASEPEAHQVGASGFLAKDQLSGPAFRRLIEGA